MPNKGSIDSIAFGYDGSTLAWSARDGVHLWELATSKELRRFGGPGRSRIPMAFSPDGKTLAIANGPDTPVIHLYEVATGLERLSRSGHQGEITSLDFSPDGKTLVTASSDTTALVWTLAVP